MNEKIIAIFCADLHLSLNPPVWRSAEEDWFEAMERPLREIKEIQQDNDCPVICAGDIFELWYGSIGKGSAELINFALSYLPDNMYAIPGQHDLPLHNLEDIKRSAYWTLVKAGKIINLEANDLINIASSELTLYGFPYGVRLEYTENRSKFLQIAVVHEYCWVDGKSYPNAPIENRLSKKTTKAEKLGYDIIVHGDNHKGFLTGNVFNCGTMMRRHSDEIDYKPQIGLLLGSGRIKIHYLDISKDKYITSNDNRIDTAGFDMSAFFEELEKLGNTSLDFVEAVKRYMIKKKIKAEVRNVILKAMEK